MHQVRLCHHIAIPPVGPGPHDEMTAPDAEAPSITHLPCLADPTCVDKVSSLVSHSHKLSKIDEASDANAIGNATDKDDSIAVRNFEVLGIEAA